MGSALEEFKKIQAELLKQTVYASQHVVEEVVVVAAPVVVAKRKRGGQVKEVKLSKAEIQKRWRDKRKAKAK